MLQSTPMPCTEDSANARLCQRVDPARAWTHAGTVDTRPLIAAVARAYTDVYGLETAMPAAAILGPSRATAVAWARHICAYLCVEDYHLTHAAAARVLGRGDHSTSVNSRARIGAALPHDTRLARVLERVRADLAGHRRADDEAMRARRDADRRRALAATSAREWDEYRYWRLRALRTGSIW